ELSTAVDLATTETGQPGLEPGIAGFGDRCLSQLGHCPRGARNRNGVRAGSAAGRHRWARTAKAGSSWRNRQRPADDESLIGVGTDSIRHPLTRTLLVLTLTT